MFLGTMNVTIVTMIKKSTERTDDSLSLFHCESITTCVSDSQRSPIIGRAICRAALVQSYWIPVEARDKSRKYAPRSVSSVTQAARGARSTSQIVYPRQNNENRRAWHSVRQDRAGFDLRDRW